jgi:MFS family permease
MSDVGSGYRRRWAVLALVLAAECMDLLDGSIVNVAAPTISSELHASTAALQWIISGYALAFAIGLLTGARLGDRYGRKRLFVAGSAGFAAASLAAALSVSPAMLIGSRLAQGAAAALLIPQGLGIIRDVFAPAEQGRALAVFGPVIGLSAVLGPIIGGALVSLDALGTGWRHLRRQPPAGRGRGDRCRPDHAGVPRAAGTAPGRPGHPARSSRYGPAHLPADPGP